MKTILHIIDTTGPGGAEVVFLQLAAHLDSEKYRSLALIRGEGWLKDSLEKTGIPLYVMDCKGSFNLVFLRSLIALIKREKVDLIQSHLLGSNVYASIAGGLLNIPVVATLHGKVDIGPDEKWLGAKLFLLGVFANRIVCVSDSLKEDLLTKSRLNHSKVVVIQNGIEQPIISQPKVDYRSQLNFDARATVLGALGNIRPAKSYDVFVQAVDLLHERGGDVHGLVAGEGHGSLLRTLKELVATRKLEEKFRFLGFTDSPGDFLADLDVYVLSSSSEGHPLALSQAMVLGLPIVATRCGVEDILEHGKDAWLIEKDNPEALAQGIECVLNMPDKGAALGLAAQQKARRLYSLDTMLEAYQNYYDLAFGLVDVQASGHAGVLK